MYKDSQFSKHGQSRYQSWSLQQQHDVCPSIGEQVACKKLLITSRAPVPVPFLSNTVLTFQKSHIPPHTSAHKHGTRKCVMKGNTLNHMTSWMGTENSAQLIAHTKWEYEHIKALPNLKVISYKSPGRHRYTKYILYCPTL